MLNKEGRGGGGGGVQNRIRIMLSFRIVIVIMVKAILGMLYLCLKIFDSGLLQIYFVNSGLLYCSSCIVSSYIVDSGQLHYRKWAVCLQCGQWTATLSAVGCYIVGSGLLHCGQWTVTLSTVVCYIVDSGLLRCGHWAATLSTVGCYIVDS